MRASDASVPEGQRKLAGGASHRKSPQVERVPEGRRNLCERRHRPCRGATRSGVASGGWRLRLISDVPSGPISIAQPQEASR